MHTNHNLSSSCRQPFSLGLAISYTLLRAFLIISLASRFLHMLFLFWLAVCLFNERVLGIFGWYFFLLLNTFIMPKL